MQATILIDSYAENIKSKKENVLNADLKRMEKELYMYDTSLIQYLN